VSADPYELLGVGPQATAAELASARRRVAQQVHPDHGGDAAAMQAVNAAYEEAVRRLSDPPVLVDPPTPTPAPTSADRGAGRRRSIRGLQQDSPSFTVDVLPVEAFEALLVVTTWIGEALVDDPPYVLEVVLREPAPCWCRLDLVPDAGATTVSLTVAAFEGHAAPDIEDVRDVWVANLNALGER